MPELRTEDVAVRWVAGEGVRRSRGMALDLAVVDPTAPQTVMGEVGLALADAERRWAEVGYWLFPAWRGRGLAAAALSVFTDWVLRELPVDRLFARTAAENPASGAVAHRAGYDLAGELADGVRVWVKDRAAPPR